MKKVLSVFGTRPEAIKLAPVIKEFEKHTDVFDSRVCVTAQHRQMLDQVLDFFSINPNYDLDLMAKNQSLNDITSKVVVGLKEVLDDFNPDFVLVHGDTTTTMAASLAAFYSGAKVGHVEAGLRTYNKNSPFPEEINRQVTGRIADIHFAPTQRAQENLLEERIDDSNILVTGNTVIDALFISIEKVKKSEHPEIKTLQESVDFSKKIILVTGHRRENFGEGFLNICKAIKEIALRDEVQVVYPVHLNPNVQKPVYEILGEHSNVKLVEPLSYEAFIWLMNRSHIIISDSGGVQEEAPSLGKPVLVMRDTTERPEAVEAGTVKLVGTNTGLIVKEASELLDNRESYQKMSKAHNPYGDGKASKRIIDFLKNYEN